MSNRRALSNAVKESKQPKQLSKPKDIDYNSQMGYRDDSPFRNKSSIDIKNLLGFKTKDKYYIIDYILGQPDLDMSFLKKQKLVLLPIFRESKNL